MTNHEELRSLNLKHSNAFFNARHWAVDALLKKVDNHFLKLGFNVQCSLDKKCFTLRLLNNKKNSWEYIDFYLWSKYTSSKVSDNYSQYHFYLKDENVKLYFNYNSNYTKEFSLVAEPYLNSQEFKALFNTVNFPFTESLSKKIDPEDLGTSSEKNLLTMKEAVLENTKTVSLLGLENYFMSLGYMVELSIINTGYTLGNLSVRFKNTKRGNWNSVDGELSFWLKKDSDEIEVDRIGLFLEHVDKETKHYINFLQLFVNEDSTKDIISNLMILYKKEPVHSGLNC